MNKFLRKRQGYVWYKDDTFLAEHIMVGLLQFGTKGGNKLKYPIMIK